MLDYPTGSATVAAVYTTQGPYLDQVTLTLSKYDAYINDTLTITLAVRAASQLDSIVLGKVPLYS